MDILRGMSRISISAAILFFIAFSASAVNAGVIVHQDDAPSVEISGSIDFSLPDQSQDERELRDAPDDGLDVTEICQEGTSTSNATMPEVDSLVTKSLMNETLSITDMDLPRKPDLDGLLRPPQKN